ncbi:MAG: dihydropteroate synthase, partial [Methanoregulaceae archaeon]|nr:dihydropteroate synthase [Methanoregulaceae archaeon]
RTVDQDWDLCRNFGGFRVFDRPLLAAVSRKSFIGDLLGVPPEKRLSGSIALAVLLRQTGADVVRTHDVGETAGALRVLQNMEKR